MCTEQKQVKEERHRTGSATVGTGGRKRAPTCFLCISHRFKEEAEHYADQRFYWSIGLGKSEVNGCINIVAHE